MACSAYSCVTGPSRPAEWEALDETVLLAFSRGAQARFLEPGATLYLQGDECKGIYCVQTGLVGVRRVDAGGPSALLRLAHPGDILGYSALLRQVDHLESAEALAPPRSASSEAGSFARHFGEASGCGRRSSGER